jgi:hypothetical protein
MNNFVILLGQRVRSGTNFIGTTLAQHPDIVTIPTKMSLGEFNLYSDDSIVSKVYDKVASKSFGMHFKPDDKSRFLKNFGDLWLDLLKNKYKIDDGKTIFVKSPSVTHAKLWSSTFPDAKIAVICRDGRDNVISSIRASYDKRSWHSMSISLKKFINNYSGRSFASHSRHWAITAREVLKVSDSPAIRIFKYEDLVGSKEQISELLKHYELRVDDEILDKCLNAPVVGSSFGVASDGKVKPNWKPDFDKSKYRFTNKWEKWSPVKKMVFKWYAGKELINLGFEKNNRW